MKSDIGSIQKELERLIAQGQLFLLDLSGVKPKGLTKIEKENYEKEVVGCFTRKYQEWYSLGLVLMKQVFPDRLVEFVSYYETDPKRKFFNIETYKIQDWMNGLRSSIDSFTQKKKFDDASVVYTSVTTQLELLKATKKRFSSSLFDIKSILQADLFDSEIDSSRELLKKGFLRAAGIIAGVVLEKHLKQVAENHNLKLTKKNPTISDFNELLKSEDIIDIPKWRQISRLGDIRNYCGHDKDREPTKEEVQELIEQTDKIIKTLF